MRALVTLLALLVASSAASAQEPDEGPGAEESDEPQPSGDWEEPKIMVLKGRRTSRRLALQVRELMEQVGDLVSSSDYERDARARGLPATVDAAFEALLPGRDLTLVVVAIERRVRRDRFLRIVYREGGYGGALLTEDHAISGDRLSQEISDRILAEARLALAALTRPAILPGDPEPAAAEASLPEPLTRGARERRRRAAPADPGTAVKIGLAAGVGAGMRSFEVPTEPGIVRLSTNPFPAALLRLVVDVEPEAQGRTAFGGELRYLTSVGLRSTDTRTDGTERNTSSRSHRLDVELHARLRLAEAIDGVSIGAGAGWGMRTFSSEAPVTLPDYTLGGLRARAFVTLPIGESVSIELAPEAVWIVSVSDALTAHGISGTALAVGGEARARMALFGAFHAEAAYRESHAFLSSDRGESSDIERWATIQLIYRP